MLKIKPYLTLALLFYPTLILANEKSIEILKQLDDMYRSESSYAKLEMIITTPNWERTLEMESWSQGTENTMIRILNPKKEKGVATLKKSNEMWNYFPKINKVIKIPSSLMMGSWMGSDITNDDLVREYRMSEDFDIQMKETKESYFFTLKPKSHVVTIWNSIEVEVDIKTRVPKIQNYYNEKNEIIRTMTFSNIKILKGKNVPFTMVLTPLNKKGNKTTIHYLELDLNLKLKENVFTMQNLQKRI